MKLTIIMPFGVKTESKLLLPLIVIEILVGMSSMQSQVLFAFTQDDKKFFLELCVWMSLTTDSFLQDHS
jgi:hypothetical protein